MVEFRLRQAKPQLIELQYDLVRVYNWGMKGNTIRIAVLGDEGVGKTSLVCAIISDLATELPKTHKKVVLPPDMCRYSKDIFTEIIDTSSETSHNDLVQLLKTSDLALLVYDASERETVVRLQNHWLRIINEHRKELPIVLVGNKYDKIEVAAEQPQDYTPVRTVLAGLVKAFQQVQMGIECSAYYDRNVGKVLNSAQRAVLYPLPPLYDLNKKQITPQFRRALLRIFRVVDHDLSGALSDADLQSLQQRVFQVQLSQDDIRAIKNMINKESQEELGHHITVKGFIAFQKKCIEMLKIQVCWSILRHFDYDDDLHIRNIDDTLLVREERGESLELTPHVVDFLNRVYRFAQVKKEEGETVMEKVFEAAPCIPFEEFNDPTIELDRFIYLWHMFKLIDYRQCYKALLYLGYDRRIDECFSVTRGKTTYSDLLKLKERNSYCVLFVSNEQMPLGQLFNDGVVKEHLTRNVAMFSGAESSKVLIMLKIRDRHLLQFFKQDPLRYRVDMLVYCSGEKAAIQRSRELIPAHVITKEITPQIADKDIKLFEMPKLNLKVFPIQIRNDSIERLLGYLLNLFQHVELGYSKEYIQRLQNESNRVKTFFALAAVGLTGVGVGVVMFLRKRSLKV